MGVLTQIRSATRDQHEWLEAHLHVNADQALEAVWVDYLRGMHAFLEPRDLWLWSRPWPSWMAPELRRSKGAWLAGDLMRLGSQPLTCATGDALSALPESRAGLLGLAYVVEGSMLGARSLRRRGAQSLGLSLRFLEGYGDQTSALWKALLGEIDGLATEVDGSRAVAAARAAFTDARHCLLPKEQRCG